MDSEIVSEYESWPLSPEGRTEVAREVLGQHLVAALGGWLNLARQMLFQGCRYKTPTPEQELYLDWIIGLRDEDRERAFGLVREIAAGAVFSILNSIDGTKGSVVRGNFTDRLRVSLEIYRETGLGPDEESGPIERIPLNAPGGVDLHDMWYLWLERYSGRGAT